MIFYDLEALEEFALELGFAPSCISPDELRVQVLDGQLVFQNLRSEEDTVAGFIGTSSHWHGKLILMTGEAEYVELNELDILQGLRRGEILVSERYLNMELIDRWLIHRKNKVDLKYIETGEEIRIKRIA